MTEFRKIIKFGRNSQIISLPKAWAKANNLEPGDSVSIEVLSNDLIISPKHLQSIKSPTRQITFTLENSFSVLRRKIINAYINNYDIIIIKGAKVHTKNTQIRSLIHQLMALEIIEESAEKITAKCYLNMDDIDLTNLTRKVDAIIKSMFIDLIGQIKDPTKFENIDLAKNIQERDADVNRLVCLIFRTVKYILDNPRSAHQKLRNSDILNQWDVSQTLEHIGDELKRTSRLINVLDKDLRMSIANFLSIIYEEYSGIMKVYYKKDLESLYHLPKHKEELFSLIRKAQNNNAGNPIVVEITDKLFYLYGLIYNLTLIFI